MSATLATADAVKAAAEQLIADKADVTIDAVLAITGGSKSTVARHVRQFRQEFSATKSAAEAPPAVLYELADPLIRKIYAAAQSEAAKVHELDANRMRSVQAWLTKENDSLQKREQELETQVHQLSTENANLVRRATELEGALDDAVVSIEMLRKELDTARLAVINETASKDRAEASIADLKASLASLRAIEKTVAQLISSKS